MLQKPENIFLKDFILELFSFVSTQNLHSINNNDLVYLNFHSCHGYNSRDLGT